MSVEEIHRSWTEYSLVSLKPLREGLSQVMQWSQSKHSLVAYISAKALFWFAALGLTFSVLGIPLLMITWSEHFYLKQQAAFPQSTTPSQNSIEHLIAHSQQAQQLLRIVSLQQLMTHGEERCFQILSHASNVLALHNSNMRIDLLLRIEDENVFDEMILRGQAVANTIQAFEITFEELLFTTDEEWKNMHLPTAIELDLLTQRGIDIAYIHNLENEEHIQLCLDQVFILVWLLDNGFLTPDQFHNIKIGRAHV